MDKPACRDPRSQAKDAKPSLRTEGEAIHPQREAMDCFVASLLAMTLRGTALSGPQTLEQDPFLRLGRRTSPTSDSVENATRHARQPLAARALAQRGAHAAEELSAPAAGRDRRPLRGRNPGRGRPDDRARDRPVRRPLSAAARAMHGRRTMPIFAPSCIRSASIRRRPSACITSSTRSMRRR